MEQKKPIQFEQAARMVKEKFFATKDAGRLGYAPGQWISDLGFHIELTGDEFEPNPIKGPITHAARPKYSGSTICLGPRPEVES